MYLYIFSIGIQAKPKFQPAKDVFAVSQRDPKKKDANANTSAAASLSKPASKSPSAKIKGPNHLVRTDSSNDSSNSDGSPDSGCSVDRYVHCAVLCCAVP